MEYHKYVFNNKERKFVGKFDQMYKNETSDPWFASDLKNMPKKIHSVVLDGRNWSSILDYGCGKGVFTHTLKKDNNVVLGVDISQNAISKAIDIYGHKVDFIHISNKLWKQKYNLIVCLEVLSYIELYKEQLEEFSNMSEYIYISLYIPKNPIGYVKNKQDLLSAVNLYFNIETQLIYNEKSIFLLAKSKNFNKF